jgi:two-component system, NtrC family, sensor histidine kinase AtoS
MTSQAYALLGLTALVAVLVSGLTFAALKLMSAARSGSRAWTQPGQETAFMAGALEQAVKTLRAEEQSLKARAEASERLSSGIISSLTSGLLVVDENGVVRTLNPAGAEMLGAGPSTGRGYRELLSDVPALAEAIGECLQSGRPIVRRAVPIRSGGTSHLGLSASPIRGPHGLQGAICLFTDLTEVMELEEQLRLQDSLARLGELTAGIAHEFRNGLATIHGYARLIDLETLPTEVRKYVQGLREETDALTEVVTRFLGFARPVKLVPARIDLAALVGRVADEVRDEAASRGGVVRVTGEYPDIEGDEVLLKQALSNLTRNALEACVEAGAPPRIDLTGTLDRRHGLLRIAITDNGPGISAEALPRLFHPFFTTKPKGTGLGLALVQKIVVMHNGRVTAMNASPRGARFEVTLPSSHPL